MKEKTKENLQIVFAIFVVFLIVLGSSRIFVFHDTESYCKLRFGEEYSHAPSSNYCYYTDYETGVREERFYTTEQLEEHCELPEYFSFKWKGDCKI